MGADWAAADVLVSHDGVVSQWLAGDQLGLTRDPGGGGGDNLNALSFGMERVAPPAFFSVNPFAQGQPGSAVHQQFQDEGFGFVGGIFQSQAPADSNILYRSTEQVGLTRGPTPSFETEDINALSLVGPPTDVWPPTDVYFSIDFDLDAPTLSSNIFLNDLANVFADASAIGLDPADDLDALWLWDVGDRGVLDPGVDQALFSLAMGSPTLDQFDISQGDILFTDFTGEFRVWKTASQLGLLPTDNLNALSSSMVPEPGTWVMWGLLAAGWPLARSVRKRRKSG